MNGIMRKSKREGLARQVKEKGKYGKKIDRKERKRSGRRSRGRERKRGRRK